MGRARLARSGARASLAWGCQCPAARRYKRFLDLQVAALIRLPVDAPPVPRRRYHAAVGIAGYRSPGYVFALTPVATVRIQTAGPAGSICPRSLVDLGKQPVDQLTWL
jgi:hypothetical protein